MTMCRNALERQDREMIGLLGIKTNGNNWKSVSYKSSALELPRGLPVADLRKHFFLQTHVTHI